MRETLRIAFESERVAAGVPDSILHRLSGPEDAPVVVYLPGLHGDWTPLNRTRLHLSRHFRLVELSYPQRAEWDLADYADAAEERLTELGLGPVHLLGESFSSLVCWELLRRHPRRALSLTLAGGFCQPPHPRGLRLLALGFGVLPGALWNRGVEAYCMSLAWRARPVAGDAQQEPLFFAARGRRGLRAMRKRLAIIQSADFRSLLGELTLPVGYIGGGSDPIVPVRREIETLRRGLPAACRFRWRLVDGAPHPILPARPVECTRFIVDVVRGSYSS